ncbi:hypothetical protein BGX26_000493 [Mortierella sp. AD094]|nr:hypothetical protein BGX26_000493 [Mortierella sp. AD094]
MAYQYFQPQRQVHQYPLLDQQYNPTETLRSLTNAVFSYLDMHHEPKGTQLLEPRKMKTLLSLMVPKEDLELNLKISNLAFNATFLAYQVETVFTAHGLLTYLRSEIMGDPDTSFKSFNTVNQVMRLGPAFVRSQFSHVPEPRAKELLSYIHASIVETTGDMGWTPGAGGSGSSEQEQLRALKVQMALEQKGQQAALDLISPSCMCDS